MVDFQIEPSSLQGDLIIPSSKSHTLRAILFSSLAKGTSIISRFLQSTDTEAMIEAVRSMGVDVKIKSDTLVIHGCSGALKVAENVIECGNSGQVLRFLGAFAGLGSEYTILTGDTSIRHNRPVFPLLNALKQLGAFAESSRGDGHAPIIIKGPLTKEKTSLDGQDSQPVSALIIAAAFAPHPIEIEVRNPGEKPWIDLTLHWLKRLGIPYEAENYINYRLQGGAQINGFNYTVPGDFSTAAFPIAAALLTNSQLCLHNMDMEDVQGDKAIIPILERMGARFMIDRINRTITVEKGAFLKGIKIDVNDCIDALPILAVIGCFAKGSTEIFNGSIARKKESDRISSICSELKKMGAQIEEREDGLLIHHSKLHGAQLNTYHDHRIALSLSIAAIAATGASTICGVKCVDKTYPHFLKDFQAIGAKLK